MTNERKAELFDAAMDWIYSRLAYEYEVGYEEALENIGFTDEEIDDVLKVMFADDEEVD